MENIQFQEEESTRKQTPSGEETRGLIRLLIRHRIAKTPRDAEMILIGSIGACITGALLIFMLGGKAPEPVPIPPGVLQSMEQHR